MRNTSKIYLKNKTSLEISKLRANIDLIDRKILNLVKKRDQISRKIITIKKNNNLPKTNRVREEEIINNLIKLNPTVSKSLIKKMYIALFEFHKR